MPTEEELFLDEEDEHELGDATRDATERARRAAAWVRERVVEHPFAALGVAVAAGFVLGRWLTR